MGRRVVLGAHAAGIVVAAAAAGCIDRPIEPLDTRTTKVITERLSQSGVDKIDLLLVIDNSGSMADKQNILSKAVPDLVQRLVNPLCIDEATKTPTATQPPSPVDDCPAGADREFEPVLDIHIGIISSSLGGHGSEACPESYVVDDKAHLLTRGPGDTVVPTYENKGFLAWDPKGKLDPPGEDIIEENGQGLVPALRDLVEGAGQEGCGYEAQLESWYRFLVDPAPYKTIGIQSDAIVKVDVDEDLLAQRKDFLRPDSLLAILMLTDENDCSTKEYGYYWKMGTGGRLPKARSECAVDANDRCCKSCAQDPGDCPLDPICGADWHNPPFYEEIDDDFNLRCWDQKRRFGIDFLYPTDRYVKALSESQLADTSGALFDNPLFPKGGRDATLVFFAGIVGVPWQDIARDPTNLEGGFKDAAELLVPRQDGATTWDLILGDPGALVPPIDPLMRESFEVRTGTQPITGEPLAPASAPADTNSINGHEWTISRHDDLQYACVFPIEPRDCIADPESCDCRLAKGTNELLNPDNPLCAPNPADNDRPTLQVRAKAYPGLRELGVLKGLGEQGIVASVCPAQTDAVAEPDYGYRPAVGAIIERLKQKLQGKCLPHPLKPDASGQVTCLVIEARVATSDEICCDPAHARYDVSAAHQAAADDARAAGEAIGTNWNCFCEVPQLTGAELDVCQSDPRDSPAIGDDPVDGWCYVDAATSPEASAKILADCPATEKRLVRLVGEGEVQLGATQFITCSGE